MKLAIVAMLVLAGTASAATLPGVRTPTRNISCFYVPIKPTARGTLLCDIKRASYTRALQHRCIDGPAGLDWHGFELTETKKAQVLCAGGVMYDIGRDTPRFVTLAYGKTWRSHGFTCVSRFSGLTCTNGARHGLFLSRASYRLY